MTSTVELERLAFAAQKVVSRELAKEFAIESKFNFAEHIGSDLAFGVTQHVLSQKLDSRIATYPSDWKQAVKEAIQDWFGGETEGKGHWPWFGSFLRTHWPVEYHVVEVDIRALYPRIALPHERNYLHIIKREQVWKIKIPQIATCGGQRSRSPIWGDTPSIA